jgi:flagellar biosynthesis activator protein FlaF
MYKFSYAEIFNDDSTEQRDRERQAFDRIITLLKEGESKGATSSEAQEAILTTQKLWGFLIENLADPDNALIDQVRADLISIGLWIIKESDSIVKGEKDTFSALIEVNQAIRDGLQ